MLEVAEWRPEHPRWPELVRLIEAEGQTGWAFEPFFAQFTWVFLVALQDGEPVGFLMFVVWEIGPHDRGWPALKIGDTTLTEAKIVAFGVAKPARRQGIGRALQLETLRRARDMGCYQVRSVTDLTHPENLRLKLSLGFAVEPMERDKECWAFVMPLRQFGDTLP